MAETGWKTEIDAKAALEAERRQLPRRRLTVRTPIGEITLVERGDAIGELRLPGENVPEAAEEETPLLRKAAQELQEYFAGTRTEFDLPLAPLGTEFQTLVWNTLVRVPYGATVSYGGLAAACGKPRAARAVGMANNRNPLPILIPCHRVIGANGKLVGYGGGLPIKAALLKLEKDARLKR